MHCIGDPPLLNNQVEERFETPSQGPFRGCRPAFAEAPARRTRLWEAGLHAGRPKASPTRPSVSEPIEGKSVLRCPTVVGPGKGFIGPPF